MRIMLPWLPLAALAAAACGPQHLPGQPVETMALVYASGRYAPMQVTVGTLDDVLELRGRAAHLRGGARVVVDSQDPLLQQGGLSDEQLAQVFLKSRGLPPRANYVQSGQVLWPADFHSWNMVTAYWNLEKAREYFIQGGIPGERISDTPVYYFPDFVLTEVSHRPLRDNALYYSPIRALMVLPFEQLQKVPLSMNFGVMAHEFSHRVFNEYVYGGQAIPDPILLWGGSPGGNLLKALDEGLADFHAYGTTCGVSPGGCDAAFLEASLSTEQSDGRDLTKLHCLSSSLQSSMNTLSMTDFGARGLEYELGTVIASALFRAADEAGNSLGTLQQALLLAYSNDDPDKQGLAQLITGNLATPGSFTPAAVVDVFLQHTSGDLQLKLCEAFMDRMKIPRDELLHCPFAAQPPTECPA